MAGPFPTDGLDAFLRDASYGSAARADPPATTSSRRLYPVYPERLEEHRPLVRLKAKTGAIG